MLHHFLSIIHREFHFLHAMFKQYDASCISNSFRGCKQHKFPVWDCARDGELALSSFLRLFCWPFFAKVGLDVNSPEDPHKKFLRPNSFNAMICTMVFCFFFTISMIVAYTG